MTVISLSKARFLKNTERLHTLNNNAQFFRLLQDALKVLGHTEYEFCLAIARDQHASSYAVTLWLKGTQTPPHTIQQAILSKLREKIKAL